MAADLVYLALRRWTCFIRACSNKTLRGRVAKVCAVCARVCSLCTRVRPRACAHSGSAGTLTSEMTARWKCTLKSLQDDAVSARESIAGCVKGSGDAYARTGLYWGLWAAVPSSRRACCVVGWPLGTHTPRTHNLTGKNAGSCTVGSCTCRHRPNMTKCAVWWWLAQALVLLVPDPSAVCKLASLRCTEHMGEKAGAEGHNEPRCFVEPSKHLLCLTCLSPATICQMLFCWSTRRACCWRGSVRPRQSRVCTLSSAVRSHPTRFMRG